MESVQLSKELDVVLDKWSNLQADVRPAFGKFIQDVVATDKTEVNQLHLYQCPTGSLSTNGVVHLLHWPPWMAGNPAYGCISMHAATNFSLQLLDKAFPDFKNQSSIDIYCRERNAHDDQGNRLKTQKLYGQDPNLPNHFALVEQYLSQIEAPEHVKYPVINVYGQAAKEFFTSTFNSNLTTNRPKFDRDSCTMEIKQRVWSVNFIPHPEWLRRWATPAARQRFQSLLQTLQQEHGIRVDLDVMKMVAYKTEWSSSDSVEESAAREFEETAVSLIKDNFERARTYIRPGVESVWDNSDFCRWFHEGMLEIYKKRKAEELGVDAEDIYEYRCYVGKCDKGFMHWGALRRHVKRVHGETAWNTTEAKQRSATNIAGPEKVRFSEDYHDESESMVKYQCYHPSCGKEKSKLYKYRTTVWQHWKRNPDHRNEEWDMDKVIKATVLQEQVDGKVMPVCPYPECFEGIKSEAGLRQHILNQHVEVWDQSENYVAFEKLMCGKSRVWKIVTVVYDEE